MVDAAPQFESEDNLGDQVSASGSVSTSTTSVPATGGGPDVEGVSVYCPRDNTPISKRLLYSTDGGGVYHTLAPGEGWEGPVRSNGGVSTKQILLKGNTSASGGVAYEIVVYRKPT